MFVDLEACLETVWDLLQEARERIIPEGDAANDRRWDDICGAMANIREELGLPDEVELERDA